MKYIKEYYLEPRFDKNAVVEVREDNDWIYEELYSYNIKVAIYKENKEYGSKIFRTFDKYSQKIYPIKKNFLSKRG